MHFGCCAGASTGTTEAGYTARLLMDAVTNEAQAGVWRAGRGFRDRIPGKDTGIALQAAKPKNPKISVSEILAGVGMRGSAMAQRRFN
jgi:hypothetical protein